MNIPASDEYGAKPLGVSWSRLFEWERCHQRSAFHLEGKGDTIKNGRMFIHGTLADRAVRKWLEQEDEQLPGQMAQYVDDLWDELVIHNSEYKIEWKGDPEKDKERVRHIAKTVVSNVEPFLIARVLPLEYEPEFRFRHPIKIPDSAGYARTIVINGGMDIVCRDPETGKIYIYDLKATTNENYVQGGIMSQLIFYGVAWTYMFGTPAEDITSAFLTPYCKIQYHEPNITRADRQHMMTRIIRFANAVWDAEPPTCTSDKNECYFCDCKRICPLWAEKLVTPRNDGKNRVSLLDTATARKTAKENNV